MVKNRLSIFIYYFSGDKFFRQFFLAYQLVIQVIFDLDWTKEWSSLKGFGALKTSQCLEIFFFIIVSIFMNRLIIYVWETTSITFFWRFINSLEHLNYPLNVSTYLAFGSFQQFSFFHYSTINDLFFVFISTNINIQRAKYFVLPRILSLSKNILLC